MNARHDWDSDTILEPGDLVRLIERGYQHAEGGETPIGMVTAVERPRAGSLDTWRIHVWTGDRILIRDRWSLVRL